MLVKILIGLTLLVVAFLGYVATREGKFRYERSGVIHASADKIFPYISNLKMGGEWSPYEKKDLNMKKTFTGADGQPGSMMEFEGNKDVGAGKIEILKIVPGEAVDLKLTMIKPFSGENLIEYRLTPEVGGTRFSWVMSGDGGFMSKLMTTLIDCEKMVTGDFETGIANLKALVESK